MDSQSAPPSPSSASSCSTTASEEERRSRVQGRRIAQIIKLKPEHVEDYKKIHKAVWPGVLKQIKDSGIRDCKLSLLKCAQFWTQERHTTINGPAIAIEFFTCCSPCFSSVVKLCLLRVDCALNQRQANNMQRNINPCHLFYYIHPFRTATNKLQTISSMTPNPASSSQLSSTLATPSPTTWSACARILRSRSGGD